MRASLRGDRHVGEQPAHQARAHRRSAHRAHHRLGAVDDVVDEVARLLPDPRAGFEVGHDLLDHREVAAGREGAAGAGDDDRVDLGIGIDVAPDLAQFAVHDRIDRVGPLLAAPHGDAQHARMRPVELQAGVVRIAVWHRWLLKLRQPKYPPRPPWMKPAFTAMAGLVPAICSGSVPRPVAETSPAMTGNVTPQANRVWSEERGDAGQSPTSVYTPRACCGRRTVKSTTG